MSELEFLTIVDGTLHFAPYLRPAHFVVDTDHQTLSFLRTASFTNARLARWAMKSQSYAFTVTYCLGSRNENADALSRLIVIGDEDRTGVQELQHIPGRGFMVKNPSEPQPPVRIDPLTEPVPLLTVSFSSRPAEQIKEGGTIMDLRLHTIKSEHYAYT